VTVPSFCWCRGRTCLVVLSVGPLCSLSPTVCEVSQFTLLIVCFLFVLIFFTEFYREFRVKKCADKSLEIVSSNLILIYSNFS